MTHQNPEARRRSRRLFGEWFWEPSTAATGACGPGLLIRITGIAIFFFLLVHIPRYCRHCIPQRPTTVY